MKYFVLRAIAATLVVFSFQSAHAVQFQVEDVSNKLFGCDSELLRQLKPGTCIGMPDNTLFVTATLEAGEDISALNELHIVATHQGQFYKYDGKAPGNRWKMAFVDATLDASSEPSIVRAPWEKNLVARYVRLGDIAAKKGAAIYVGVGTKVGTGMQFLPKNIKQIFTVK